MGPFGGYLAALLAAIMYGVQYVPVKKYEIYDGTTFQWFMCNGILMVGCLISIATGDISRGVSLLCMMGGAFWALSNFLVIPLVKLLGIGLGFALYHFVNLLVGYGVGRLGLFGLPHMRAATTLGLWPCDLGCGLLLLGFMLMVCVETGSGAERTQPPLPECVVSDLALEDMREFRERYRRWRLGEARGASDKMYKALVGAVGPSQHGSHRFLNFGMYAVPEAEGGAAAEQPARGPPRAAPAEPPDEEQPRLKTSLSEPLPLTTRLLEVASDSARAGAPDGGGEGASGQKVLGVALAIVGGAACGVNGVPPSLYALQHPELTPFAAVFSQCLGIWMVSSLIYLGYSSLARLVQWRVPHSVIRPAYLSGCIWAGGFACMLTGIRQLGYSVGYTLDAVGPVIVSSIISIVVYREISGAKQLALFSVSFLCQLSGVGLIASFGTQ